MKNLEKYRIALDKLIKEGNVLLTVMHYECFPDTFDIKNFKFTGSKSEIAEKKAKKIETLKKIKEHLLGFKDQYQSWYSEALSIVSLLLPERVSNFICLYERAKGRKEVDCSNYVIEDFLYGLITTRGERVVTDKSAAIPKYEQQLNILKACKKRFESALFDLKNLIQADLFDSELDAALELNKKGFTRGAGAMAGVVLEHHLLQVCQIHKIDNELPKKPAINDYNTLLYKEQIIDLPTMRHIQLLADLRNLCDHKKETDPTKEQVKELIEGTSKIIKTIF